MRSICKKKKLAWKIGHESKGKTLKTFLLFFLRFQFKQRIDSRNFVKSVYSNLILRHLN